MHMTRATVAVRSTTILHGILRTRPFACRPFVSPRARFFASITSQPNSASTDNSFIPVVDFGAFSGSISQDERTDTALKVFKAFKETGFVYLKNHGIKQESIDEAFAQSKQFFALSQEEKNKLAWVSPRANRGYVAPGREKVSLFRDHEEISRLREKSPDIKESIEIGKEYGGEFQNNWPAGMPKFRNTMLEFYENAHLLHLEILRSLAIGFRLQENFFDQCCSGKDHNLRLLHYPSCPKTVLDREGQDRAGSHTDYGSITLLFQDDKGGLQVLNNDGVYVNAMPMEGTIVVNAGDLLARWSNNIIKSTEHRVVSPPFTNPSDPDYPERYSIAYFCNPDFGAVVECLPGCWDESHPKQYEPIECLEYLVSRLSATY